MRLATWMCGFPYCLWAASAPSYVILKPHLQFPLTKRTTNYSIYLNTGNSHYIPAIPPFWSCSSKMPSSPQQQCHHREVFPNQSKKNALPPFFSAYLEPRSWAGRRNTLICYDEIWTRTKHYFLRPERYGIWLKCH